MILNHLKNLFNLKAEDGNFFHDLFRDLPTGRPELREKRAENRKEMTQKFVETVYSYLDSSSGFSDEKMDKSEKNSQLFSEKIDKIDRGRLDDLILNFFETFKTKEHIFWSMELIGTAFLFVGEENFKGVNYERVYEKALEIYKIILRIVCSEDRNMIKIKGRDINCGLNFEEEDKQRLMREIFGHLSLSFEKVDFLKKSDFCLKVIEVYGRYTTGKFFSKMSDETWEFMLLLLIGITDFILGKKIEPKIYEELSHYLIMTLMNAWIFSGMRDSGLWKTFTQYARQWQNLDLFVSKWRSVCLGLTRKILGDSYKLPFFKIKFPKDFETNKRAKINEIYEEIHRASSLLCISYDKLRVSDRSDSVSSVSALAGTFESNTIFWAKLDYEQGIFLWYKFLHLFEIHNCEKEKDFKLVSNVPDSKFVQSLLKCFDDIIDEIFKVGYPSKKLTQKKSTKELLEEFKISKKNLSSLEKRCIKARRIEKTHCCDSPKMISKVKQLIVSSQDDEKKYLPSNFNAKDFHSALDKESLLFLFTKKKIASADAILSIFNKWLVQNANSTQPGFEKVSTMAIDTLAKVFRKGKGPVIEKYLLLFYTVLVKNFEKIGDFKILFKVGTALFRSDLPYLNSVLRTFLERSDKHLKQLISSNNIKTEEKTISYLNKFLCWYFGRSEYIITFENLERASEKSLYTLDHWINYGFDIIKIENKGIKKRFLKVFLWIVCSNSCLKNQFSSVIQNIYDACLIYSKKKYPNEKSMNLKLVQIFLEILISAGEIYHWQKNKLLNSKLSLASLTKDIKESNKPFLNLILNLLDALNLKVKLKDNLNLHQKETEIYQRITLQIIQALYIWNLLGGNEILESDVIYESLKLFLEAFVTAADFIGIASSNMLKSLLNNIGKNFFAQNVMFCGTALSDVVSFKQMVPLSENMLEKEYESFNLSLNTDIILSIYKGRNMSANEDIIVLIRNAQGRFVWQGELIYKMFSKNSMQKLTGTSLPLEAYDTYKSNQKFSRSPSDTSDPTKTRRKKEDAVYQSNVKNHFMKQSDPLLSKIERQFALDEDYDKLCEANHKYIPIQNALNKQFLEEETHTYCKTDSNEGTLLNIAKLFLSHFGLLSVKQTKVQYLNNSENLKDALKELDTIPERSAIWVDCYFIGDIYSENISRAPETQVDYYAFLESIGCYLDEKSFATGLFDSAKTHIKQYGSLYYSSNMIFECLFFQPPDYLQGKAHIMIVWNSRINDEYDNKFPNFFNNFIDGKRNLVKSFILITPLSKYLFKIKVFEIIDDKNIIDINVGPLISGMLITREKLPALVQTTIYNIYRTHNFTGTFAAPNKRQSKINQICVVHSNKEKFNSLLNLLNISNFSKIHPGISTMHSSNLF